MEEHCCQCDEPTGRAGRADDSLYCCDLGPFCEECYNEHLKTEHRCSVCGGHGTVRVLRDAHGHIDYLHGRWNGHEMTTCSYCHGEGYRI